MEITKFDVLKRAIVLIDLYGPVKFNICLTQAKNNLENETNKYAEIIINAVCKAFNIKYNKLILNKPKKRRTSDEAATFFYCVWLCFVSNKISRAEITTALKMTKFDWNIFYNRQKEYHPDILNTKISLHKQLKQKLDMAMEIIKSENEKL